MPDESSYQNYWSRVIDALACIYIYSRAGTDDFQYYIRYRTFPEAVQRARIAYYYCESLPLRSFGMHGDEADIFFSDLVMDGERLDAIYSKALDNYCSGAPTIPMRLL